MAPCRWTPPPRVRVRRQRSEKECWAARMTCKVITLLTGSAADTGCPATAGEKHILHSLHEVFVWHRWNLLAAGSSAVCLITSAASDTLAMIAHAESGGMPQIKHE